MVGTRFYGRLGNVLYQAAHCISFALKHNLDFSFPNKTNDPYWNPIYLQHLVNPNWVQGREDILINERCHEWQPIEFKEEWRDKQVVLNGYWQSWKYFRDYRNQILYLFDVPWEQKDFVSIHIRRGDYLRLPEKHPPFSIEYMRAATSKFYLKGFDKFKVFSDDIPWCREHFKDDHYSAMNIEFSTNHNEVDDLVEMSCGIHHINSSSTFSVWGAELNRNPDKIVVTPKKWFVDGYHLNTNDIIPPEWIKL